MSVISENIYFDSYFNLSTFTATPELYVGSAVLQLAMYSLTAKVFLIDKHKNGAVKLPDHYSLGFLIFFFTSLLVLNEDLTCASFLLESSQRIFLNDYLAFLAKFVTTVFVSIYFLTTQFNSSVVSLSRSFEYTSFVFAGSLGTMLLCSANDFITAYLAIELQSIAFYLMACSKKNSGYSIESGLKYFVVGSLSSGLILFGVSLIYGSCGTLNFFDLKILTSLASDIKPDSVLSNEMEREIAFRKAHEAIETGQIVLEPLDFTIENPEAYKELLLFFDQLSEICGANLLTMEPNVKSDPNFLILSQTELGVGFCKAYEAVKAGQVHLPSSEFIKGDTKAYEELVLFFDQLDKVCGKDLLMTEPDVESIAATLSQTEVGMAFCKVYEAIATGKVCLPSLEFSKENTKAYEDLLLFFDQLDKVCGADLLMIEPNAAVLSQAERDLIFHKAHEAIEKGLVQLRPLDFTIENPEAYEKLRVFFEELNALCSTDDPFLGPKIENWVELVALGLSFVCLGIFIKLAVAPFHLWAIDVYEGSPNTSTYFFSVIPKIGLFVLLIRLCYFSTFSVFYQSIASFCLFFSICSLIVGALGGLEQRKLKSLLAYSSVSHTGYLLLSFSSGTEEGLSYTIYYLIIYMLSVSGFWCVYTFLRKKDWNYSAKENKELGDLTLLGKSNPTLATAMAIIMFSLAGIPPLAGFLIKFNVFFSVVQSSAHIFAVLGVALSVVSTFYYIRLVKVLFFENRLVGNLHHPVSHVKAITIVLIAFALVIVFVKPSVLYLAASKAMLIVF